MPNYFPKCLYHFAFLPTMNEWSSFPTSLSAFDIVTMFYSSHSDVYSAISSSICISLMIPFYCAYLPSIFFSELSLYVFCPYSHWIVCFFNAIIESSLYFIDALDQGLEYFLYSYISETFGMNGCWIFVKCSLCIR